MSKTTKPATASAKTMTKSPTAPAPEPKTFVAFGGDEHGKPRAARFTGVALPVLAKAADAMNLRVYEVKGGDLAVVAKRLPAGLKGCASSAPPSAAMGTIPLISQFIESNSGMKVMASDRR